MAQLSNIAYNVSKAPQQRTHVMGLNICIFNSGEYRGFPLSHVPLLPARIVRHATDGEKVGLKQSLLSFINWWREQKAVRYRQNFR